MFPSGVWTHIAVGCGELCDVSVSTCMCVRTCGHVCTYHIAGGLYVIAEREGNPGVMNVTSQRDTQGVQLCDGIGSNYR